MSRWIEMLEWMKAVSVKLPPVWPTELPPESDLKFWTIATKFEFQTRAAISAKLTSLVATGELPPTTPLEHWFFHRRFEWAAQLAEAKAKAGVEPPVPLKEVLLWALVKTWTTDGCIAFWNNAERAGKPYQGGKPKMFQ